MSACPLALFFLAADYGNIGDLAITAAKQMWGMNSGQRCNHVGAGIRIRQLVVVLPNVKIIAGYIGSHTCVALLEAGHDITVVDLGAVCMT